MLGLRGVRLGLVVPGLYALQVRALAEATLARIAAGETPSPRSWCHLLDQRVNCS